MQHQIWGSGQGQKEVEKWGEVLPSLPSPLLSTHAACSAVQVWRVQFHQQLHRPCTPTLHQPHEELDTMALAQKAAATKFAARPMAVARPAVRRAVAVKASAEKVRLMSVMVAEMTALAMGVVARGEGT